MSCDKRDAPLFGGNNVNQVNKRNIGHSIFQRLLNYAKTNGDDFNFLLLRYGVERFLYRLGISRHADRFVLKGASLFLVWKGQNYRVTKDADLLGFGHSNTEDISILFKELCQFSSGGVDGIEFMSDTVTALPIREEQEYDGIRVTLMGILHQAHIPLQIDIGFGDVVTPTPEKIEFPTLLGGPAPQLLAYPRYTMIAEKFESMVCLGIANSRMKDFYDIWLSSKIFEFDGRVLCEAVNNTFNCRSTLLPDGLPFAFTDEFRKDTQKLIQWRAFVRKSKPEMTSDDLNTVIEDVATFLMPAIEALQNNNYLELIWIKGGPWSK